MSMENVQQKDLVLSPNEFAFVLDETKGHVACWVGPVKTSLSQSDRLVRFDNEEKKFIPCAYKDAIQLFITVPEGYYAALKNPAANNKHPQPGTSNSTPENMETGRKINISGPDNFALYPGQMAQVIKAHTLRSNQYLLARVYDADALNQTKEERNADKEEPEFINGQILIIKGTEITFYIPPNGIEVIPIHNNSRNGYVREAVTLERLEYCILKDENGEKRYVHGPAVVFPKPTEYFVKNNDSVKYKAIELSDISGVYVKVIADYTENCIDHKIGEELFITGKQQMIYYPRPEHTFITYNDKIVHHAIAIPKGQGRYIMNRMTGEIKTVRGPAMYLPDPRTEVVVKRTLTKKQCDLWYPGNEEVLQANGQIDVGVSINNNSDFVAKYCTSAYNFTSAAATPTTEYVGDIQRSETFTKPRSISLDSSKYDGAVSIDVWTGYAVNLVSKDGTREVVKGPQTILLDYDQSLEVLELSTGKPKTTDNLQKVVFLRHENNRVSDIINVETNDFVHSSIKVSYLVDFDEDNVNKWFSVDNYVKHLCDWARSEVKKAVKKLSITELYENYSEIVAQALTKEEDNSFLKKFSENGMMLSSVEVFSLDVTDALAAKMIEDYQEGIVEKALNLNEARVAAATDKEILALNRESSRLNAEYKDYKLALEDESKRKRLELEATYNKMAAEEEQREKETAKLLESLENEICKLEEERQKSQRDGEIAYERAKAEIESKRMEDTATAIKTAIEAIGPDLAMALNNSNNQEIVKAMAESISPYAIAEGESASAAVNRLVRGTPMEEIFKMFKGE